MKEFEKEMANLLGEEDSVCMISVKSGMMERVSCGEKGRQNECLRKKTYIFL